MRIHPVTAAVSARILLAYSSFQLLGLLSYLSLDALFSSLGAVAHDLASPFGRLSAAVGYRPGLLRMTREIVPILVETPQRIAACSVQLIGFVLCAGTLLYALRFEPTPIRNPRRLGSFAVVAAVCGFLRLLIPAMLTGPRYYDSRTLAEHAFARMCGEVLSSTLWVIFSAVLLWRIAFLGSGSSPQSDVDSTQTST